jgi:hypothetical protein
LFVVVFRGAHGPIRVSTIDHEKAIFVLY